MCSRLKDIFYDSYGFCSAIGYPVNEEINSCYNLVPAAMSKGAII